MLKFKACGVKLGVLGCETIAPTPGSNGANQMEDQQRPKPRTTSERARHTCQTTTVPIHPSLSSDGVFPSHEPLLFLSPRLDSRRRLVSPGWSQRR